jgi:hypothetical protein
VHGSSLTLRSGCFGQVRGDLMTGSGQHPLLHTDPVQRLEQTPRVRRRVPFEIMASRAAFVSHPVLEVGSHATVLAGVMSTDAAMAFGTTQNALWVQP